MNIAVVAETAPAKTIIPIIEKVDADILSLTHSEGAMELLGPYSNEIFSMMGIKVFAGAVSATIAIFIYWSPF